MQNKNILILLGLMLFIVACTPVKEAGNNNNNVTFTFEITTVSRVIDGDTLVLQSGEKVRLICINTPEKGEVGFNEAKSFLENMTLGVPIAMEKDVSDKDRYGRLLRYIYIDRGRTISVNEELVRLGFAEVARYPPDTKHCGEYEAIQNKIVV